MQERSKESANQAVVLLLIQWRRSQDICSVITREVFQDGFDVSERVRSLLGESREDIKNLMLVFKDNCDQELSDPWSKLTLLIVISGEIFAVALANEEHHQKQEVMKLLYTVAEDLCSRITKLPKGSWVSEK